MDTRFIRGFLQITKAPAAWDFAKRYLGFLRKDPELGKFPAEEIFLSELRWCFGESNLEKDMSFEQIQMWSKIANRLISPSRAGAGKIGDGTKRDCAMRVDSLRKPLDQAIDKIIEIVRELPWSLQPNVSVHSVVDLTLLEAFKTAEGKLAEQRFFNALNMVDDAKERLFD